MTKCRYFDIKKKKLREKHKQNRKKKKTQKRKGPVKIWCHFYYEVNWNIDILMVISISISKYRYIDILVDILEKKSLSYRTRNCWYRPSQQLYNTTCSGYSIKTCSNRTLNIENEIFAYENNRRYFFYLFHFQNTVLGKVILE